LLTWTLDDELEALARGDVTECLVCGGHLEAEDSCVRCEACGSVLAAPEASSRGELSLV
jgi:hypothetical protein